MLIIVSGELNIPENSYVMNSEVGEYPTYSNAGSDTLYIETSSQMYSQKVILKEIFNKIENGTVKYVVAPAKSLLDTDMLDRLEIPIKHIEEDWNEELLADIESGFTEEYLSTKLPKAHTFVFKTTNENELSIRLDITDLGDRKNYSLDDYYKILDLDLLDFPLFLNHKIGAVVDDMGLMKSGNVVISYTDMNSGRESSLAGPVLTQRLHNGLLYPFYDGIDDEEIELLTKGIEFRFVAMVD